MAAHEVIVRTATAINGVRKVFIVNAPSENQHPSATPASAQGRTDTKPDCFSAVGKDAYRQGAGFHVVQGDGNGPGKEERTSAAG
jgi:hypothetical protein